MTITEIITELVSWFFSTFTSFEEALETCRTVWRLYRLLAWLTRLARRAHRWFAQRRTLPPSHNRLGRGDDPSWAPVWQVQHDAPLILTAARQDDELCVACDLREDASHLEVNHLSLVDVSDRHRRADLLVLVKETGQQLGCLGVPQVHADFPLVVPDGPMVDQPDSSHLAVAGVLQPAGVQADLRAPLSMQTDRFVALHLLSRGQRLRSRSRRVFCRLRGALRGLRLPMSAPGSPAAEQQRSDRDNERCSLHRSPASLAGAADAEQRPAFGELLLERGLRCLIGVPGSGELDRLVFIGVGGIQPRASSGSQDYGHGLIVRRRLRTPPRALGVAILRSKDILLSPVDCAPAGASPATYEQHSCARDDGAKHLAGRRSHDVQEPRIAHDVASSRSDVVPLWF